MANDLSTHASTGSTYLPITPNPCPTQAISIRQPWAWAIINGLRPVELRTWSTNFRGTIAIHAGQSRSDMTDVVESYLRNLHPIINEAIMAADPDAEAGIGSYPVIRGGRPVNPTSQFHFGAIVGTVDIVDCLTIEEAFAMVEVPNRADGSPAARIHPMDWVDEDATGYVWLVQNAVKFANPIEARGKLSLFAMPPDLCDRVAAERASSVAAMPAAATAAT